MRRTSLVARRLNKLTSSVAATHVSYIEYSHCIHTCALQSRFSIRNLLYNSLVLSGLNCLIIYAFNSENLQLWSPTIWLECLIILKTLMIQGRVYHLSIADRQNVASCKISSFFHIEKKVQKHVSRRIDCI